MVMLGALLLVCISALALALPARPDAGMPAAWFLVAILPVSNLLFPIGVLLGERLLYVASVALSLAAASVWTFAARHTAARWRRPCLAAAVAVLAALAARSFVRNPDWRDSAAYYAALNRDHPESYRAQWGNAAGALAAIWKARATTWSWPTASGRTIPSSSTSWRYSTSGLGNTIARCRCWSGRARSPASCRARG
jgi:hypothetical protein